MNNQPIISCQNVGKIYEDGTLHVEVLQNLTFDVNAGESVSIIGASGSGKSTLLHIFGWFRQTDFRQRAINGAAFR